MRHALDERWELTPDRALHIYRDLYGNTCQRFSLPQGPECLRYEAPVEALDAGDEVDVNAVPYPVEDRPPTTLIDTLPSRYCLVVPGIESHCHAGIARDSSARPRC